MDWETRRKKRQEMGSADSGSTSEARDASLSVADAWERRRAQRQQMDAGSEEARRQRSEEIDRINQARKDQRSLDLAQDITLGIANSVVNHWIHPYRSSQADLEWESTLQERPQQMSRWAQMEANAYAQKQRETQRSLDSVQKQIDEIENDERAGAYHPEYQTLLKQRDELKSAISGYGDQLKSAAEKRSQIQQYQAQVKAAEMQSQIAENPANFMRWARMEADAYQKKLDETEYDWTDNQSREAYNALNQQWHDKIDAANALHDYAQTTMLEQEAAAYTGEITAPQNPGKLYRLVNDKTRWASNQTRQQQPEGNRGADSPDAFMSETQRNTFNYLAGVKGEDAAEAYYELIKPQLEAARSANTAAEWAERTEEHPYLATVTSVLMTPLKIPAGLASVARASFGVDVNTNDTLHQVVHAQNAIRQTAPEVTNWTGDATIFGKDADTYIYSTIVSALDSALNMVISGVITGAAGAAVGGFTAGQTSSITSNLVSGLMGAEMLPDTIMQEKAKGRSDSEAVAIGIIRSLVEAITEKYSIEAFLGDPLGVAKRLEKAFIAEGSEEVASNWLNRIVDIAVKDPDNLKAQYDRLKESGAASGDALTQVIFGAMEEDAGSFLAGGISGLAMGGAAELADYTQRLQAYTQPYADRGNVQALVDEAMELDPENPLAASIQRKLSEKGGDSVSNREIYRLVRQNETAIQEGYRAAVQSAAAARLSELGETGDVGAIGAALAKQAAGEELSGAEQQLISSSRYGQRVANELDPEKIRSGEYSSSWAERIGTNRLNPEEYSRLVEAAQRPSAPENAAEEPEVRAEKPAEEPAEAAVQAKPDAAAPVLPQRETAAQAEEAAAADAAEQESPVTLEDASKKYGAQAGAMVHTYQPGQDVAAYDRAYEIAYEMGRSGVNRSYAMKSAATAYLTETQRELAYEAGQAAADTAAASQAEKNTGAANGRTGWKKGTVRGEGVTIADLKQTFNDPQGQAYRYLSAVAEATGIDIVLYKSEANAEGEFEGAQGRFLWDENTIYIDVNAGLAYAKDAGEVSKYAMLRTFAHEFTHFIEKWNPVQYNEFRKVVFDTLTERGENVHDLIEEKQAQDSSGKMTYEQASREVVAEAMTDILPDSSFVQELAENHRSIFTKLHEKLKEFVKNLRAYFASIGHNRSREANALKEQVGDTVKYLGSVVQLFDRAAVQAVENYQKTVATEEAKSEKAAEEDDFSDINPEEIRKALEERADKPSPFVERVMADVEKLAGKQEPVTETDPYGFTITDNPEHGSLEITFGGKPSWQVRDALKANKFRWNGKKGVWYGYGDRSAIVELLHAAYEAEGQTAADAQPIPEPVEEAEPVSTDAAKPAEAAGKTPSEKLADSILSGYLNGGNVNRTRRKLTARELYALADAAFGGTQAEGAYNRKDAYDALELAVNKFLLSQAAADTFNGNAADAVKTVQYLEGLLELLPTQSVRTQEQQEFQQFSTPPNIAYLAAWAANIRQNDAVLEPSAGIGGLAVFAKAWGAEVAVNELSERRLEVLRSMGFDHLFHENAEQIDNILPEEISPGVVLMNPPFSATAGRTGNNKTSNAERHLDQALSRLRSGGRLVAILGKGMNNTDYARYWNRLRRNFNIRANLSIDGSNYKKYGTTWGVQLVVIDKTGPQTGETITGSYTDLTELPNVLEGIRNDRRNLEETGAAGGGDHLRQSVSDRGDRQSEGGHTGSRVRSAGDAAGDQSGANRKGAAGNGRNGRRSVQGGVPEAGPAAAGSQDGGEAGTAGRGDSGSGNVVSQSGASDRHQPELPLPRLSEQEAAGDDGVYAAFVAPEIPLKGGKRHPAMLVESAAMAAVSMPEATYRPKLPDDVVKQNLSDAQLVTVTYAGQAHAQMLPDGRRKGFFIGDGTGVGKGRQIAGIILDNFMQGRKKAVWISKNDDLYGDAVRDWTATTGRSRDEVVNHSKFKPKDRITIDEGILFTSYGKLKAEKGGSRLDQIVDWLGEDFDGVIAFDEAHFMGNLYGKKGKFGKSSGSLTAKAGVELQRRLPNARILYVSATAATEVDNLAYAERIGLWGAGTAFTDAKDFISKIGSSGLAAMELVIRDMKAMGSYVARSISYNGVTYDTVEHTLTPMQTEIYNTMSRAWQSTMSNALNALEITGGKNNSTERQRALGNFYSSMQRFYNQVLTSMSMPSVIADMRRELAAGHSCVLQIVNTNEAQQNKQLAEAKAEGRSLDDLDLTPREALIGYLMNSFPTQMFEEYTDEDGNLRSRPVYDSSGKPVQSKEAIRKRDALIEEVNRMSIPDGPLEMLFDAFGTDAVAENTGRSRRVVPKKMPDGSISRVEERRTLNHRTADVQAFQDGKKRILVFSDAGGTGKSYHADLSEKNQQLRVHYVLQPGWVASNAVQGFGRTNRSNQALPPQYKLVTTNIKGQKRFTSTIARRLDQLGALTKGQRDTGSGMFGAKDNLETDLARDSLREFYRRLGKNQIEGVDGMKTLDRLGLRQKFTDEYGAFKLNDVVARDISTFLNRILALEVEEQNTVFDAFISIYEMELEAAIQSGTLDTGMENVRADRIEVVDDKVIRQDENTGASTHYIQAKTYTKPKVVTTVAEMAERRQGFIGVYRTESGAVRAVFRIADKTTEWGAVQKQFRLVGPNLGAKTSVWSENTLSSKAEAVEKADWQTEWDKEVAKVPEYNEDTLHMLTGALLPIWNSLPQEGNTRVKRLVANDGSTYLGRVIEKDRIDSVLRRFSLDRTREVFTAQQVMDKALQSGVRFQLENSRAEIFRSRVSGEWRLEITQQNAWYLTRSYPGIIQERIQYRDRYFIPVGEKGTALLEKLLSDNPVRNTVDGDAVQEQQRTNTLTDREVLAMAASEIPVDELTDAERNALRIFQERLSRLEALQKQRKELGQLYKEQQFGKDADREEAAKTLNRMHILDGQIQRASTDVLGVEEKTVLRRVLQKARTVVERQERQHGQEILKRWRDRRNNAAAIRKYRERIRKDVDDLTSWVLHPGNKDVVKHIPDALKGSVIPFLSSINFTSERSLRGGEATKADKEFLKRLNSLETALKQNRDVYGLYSGYNDLPADFMDTLHAFIKNVQEITGTGGEFVINRMTSEELKTLSGMVKALKTYIKQFNRFHVNAMYQHVYEAGDDTIQELSGMENAGPHTGKISNFVFWQQIRPAYAFERFGKGGMAIYDGLRRGQATLAFNTRTITEFTDKTYTAEEVRAWEKEIKKIKLGDDLVQMPVSAIMSFYELSKRPQALGHILGQGIRVATYVSGKQKISDIGHVITPEDVSAIIAALTPRQKEVADSLQKFMAGQGGTWGNYVSVKRFGEELFGEEHYFPIHSDGRHLQATADEHPSAASLYALLNMSFTKELTEKANNRIILYSIFDVFSNHMASMAQYNAFALPVLDALKWFNYQQRDLETREVLDSVRDQMDRVYGVPEESRPGSGRRGYAETFVINILKAFNGTEAQGVPTDATWLNELRRYNMAQVAYNFRVVVQQPLAITRAGLLVDYSSILKGMKLRPAAIRQNIAEMRRYSGIAAWKALGFYDVNISRGLTEIIKHKETVRDKVSEVGMWGAEQADTITWAAIWSACKEEVTKKQKLRPRDAGFYEAVTKLFEDVIYKTQVVDSVLTKNEYLRSKGVGARLIGSFMSEPTTTASMLIDVFDKYRADLQRGMTKTQAWKKNRSMIGRTAYVYAVSALILAAVQAAADALRDDDDYETFGEKWLEAFGGNLVDELMPLNKLPVLRDFYELGKEILSVWGVDTYGNAPRSVFMQWYDSLVKGVQILHDKIYGDDTNYTWYGGIYKLLQAVSGMTGLPMAAATREIITAWNTVIGSMAPSLKVQTYEPKPLANIRYAYEDGYLTAEEATAEMLAQDLVDSEDEAYFTIQGWEAGDGYSRFDAIFEAARNGGSIDAEMDELTAHGYTEKDVLSKVKGQIGTWYKEGEITKQQAEKLLGQYFDMDSDEITELVNKWSCVVVTGIEYDDIKQEYLDSNLTEQRAVEMRVRYGGDSKEDAAETVTKWKAEKETGIAYDDIKDALLDGDITEASARKMYVKYGGYSEEEAAEKVTVISFVGEHPDCEDISYAAIEDYTTYCEAAGVSASAFYDVWKYNSSTHADVDENGESISGSKKVKVLAYIDALPLTAAQKDSLYYAFGWAESTIGDSPWH